MIKDKAFQIIHKDNVSAVAMSPGSIIWYTLKHQISTETSSPTVVLTDVIENRYTSHVVAVNFLVSSWAQ
ncbi:Uncharacterized protein APZ42_027324 [Daphnia magna]|uniref:Uncharacterized protein n=1 Tax=Daphnia magna TaxID=35525 RepID=A0A164RGK5_9CRUS|nr:Uncharacterized protein APZ42_027324 [Daphnia magna]